MHYIVEPFLAGVDEAGRGPLAGPVSVGVVVFLKDFDTRIFEDVRDSKQLSEKKRVYFLECMDALVAEGALNYAVAFSSSKSVDTKGIVFAIRDAMARSIDELRLDAEKTTILLDGSLQAPEVFKKQRTIIKGDETELPITLAGIAAKVVRDREMVRLSKEFPEYGFEKHKGYGTKHHQEMLKKHGISAIHRETFIDLTKY